MLAQSSQYKQESTVKPLAAQISQTAWFNQLQAQLQKLQFLQQLFDRLTDFSLAPHCLVLSINQTCLLLGVENTAWAAHLQYRIPTLLTKLHGHPEFQSIDAIQVTTLPISQEPTPPTRTPTAIAAESAAALAEVANSVTDPALKQALLKLARNS